MQNNIYMQLAERLYTWNLENQKSTPWAVWWEEWEDCGPAVIRTARRQILSRFDDIIFQEHK